MDIYSLINSKAISDHCRSIAHRFTPLEMAYLVYANDTLNIPQKHTAFEEIIRTQPNMEVVERPWTPHYDSLHDFLMQYMRIEQKYIAAFYQDEPNCVYSFEVLYSEDRDYTEDGRIFSTFALCYKAIRTEIDQLVADYKESGMDISAIDIRIKKQWINVDGDEYPKHITVCIDYENNPTEIWSDCSAISSEDNDVLCAFEGLWPEIPTPFQKGDILITRCRGKSDASPFVLDGIPYWDEDGKYAEVVAHMREGGDSTDLITTIYGQDKDGTVWNDHGPSYLDMEYCDREMIGTERFLIALSNYLKGELPLELLVRSYDILKNEQRALKDRDLISGFYGSLLKKAGLEEDEYTHK